MGILFVMFAYAAGLTVLAAVTAAALGLLAHLLTRRSLTGHKSTVVASVLFPFLCVCFAGLWFVGYAVVNQVLFHRDPMLGDTWQTPLPNGYALLMIDVTDQGTVYNPKTQPDGEIIGPAPDAASGVRQLQVAGNRIYGARDSGYFDRIGTGAHPVDTWFDLDTAHNLQKEFATSEDLRKQAASEGNTLQLREFASVFQDYRTTWFDYAAGIVLVLVPACGFVLLVRRVLRVHRLAAPAS